MKKVAFSYLLALLVSVGSAPLFAEESMDDIEKRCRGYAEEEKVPAEDVDLYIKECVDSIMQDRVVAEEKND
jgi:hypothetical protein